MPSRPFVPKFACALAVSAIGLLGAPGLAQSKAHNHGAKHWSLQKCTATKLRWQKQHRKASFRQTKKYYNKLARQHGCSAALG